MKKLPIWAERIKGERRRLGWSQNELAKRLTEAADQLGVRMAERASLIRNIKNWEAGVHQPRDPYPQLFALALGMPESDLFGGYSSAGFDPNQEIVEREPENSHLAQEAIPATRSLLVSLDTLLRGHIQTDAMLGSALVLPSAEHYISVLTQTCRVTHGSDRKPLLELASQFVEFFGWLYQDSGDYVKSIAWTNMALDYAMELNDARAISYILMRKSNIASESGDPGHALGLINAALAYSSDLTPRLRAALFRQRANAYAMSDDTGRFIGFQRASDEAMSEAVSGISQIEDDLATYCTPAYVEMELGASLVSLGQSHDAIQLLEKSRSRWADEAQARDNALCFARLATAYAVMGEPLRSCMVAQDALQVARSVRSARLTQELLRLARHLNGWSSEAEVHRVISLIKERTPSRS
ncbi:hypothetical protein [Acrocarpospora catenulata]|uniref:hypothetical protein n=1 Tax=Acrocarpospora catenulata TaxID=2836182 RepID=UPI001BDB6475|nr:hypothetical protein [Acrocarpospora catenulata]